MTKPPTSTLPTSHLDDILILNKSDRPVFCEGAVIKPGATAAFPSKWNKRANPTP
jgi:hypothetical protein